MYRVSYKGSNGGMNLGPIGFIIAINLILVVLTTIKPEIRFDLGLIPQRIFDDPLNSWTMITNMFLHAGFWHFFTNMLTLFFFGNYLIRLIGNRYFFIIYFLAGLLGNVFYLWLGEPISLAIGASGAVFGIAGALTMLRPKLKVFIFPIPVPIPLWIAVLGVGVFLSFSSGVAWEAHLGGLLLGLGAGYLFRRQPRLD